MFRYKFQDVNFILYYSSKDHRSTLMLLKSYQSRLTGGTDRLNIFNNLIITALCLIIYLTSLFKVKIASFDCISIAQHILK